ncbi:MAG TPA: glycoside hydrolase family 2 TIM barrel-domain containing protein [bacterium]|nr:glycoside hydrolase family 2 TIM barrel-domain containing protein [bacterium]
MRKKHFGFSLLLIILAGFFTVFLSSCSGPKPQIKDFKVSFIPKPWEVNVERSYTMLDKDWKFFKSSVIKIKDIEMMLDDIVDPKNYVLRDGTVVPFGKKCKDPYMDTCDDSSWITMDIPFNWFDLGKEMDAFRGKVWYRKKFNVDEKDLSGKAILNFWGVYYRAWVYLNGERIGFHEGGYTPFSFDITDKLKQGDNLLAVRVSNELGMQDIPIGDWWNYGGIHREVFIEYSDKTSISDLHIKPSLSDDLLNGKVDFEIKIDGENADKAGFFIYKLNGEDKELIDSVFTEIKPGENIITGWETENPALWSPETPELYYAKAVLFKNGKVIDGLGDMFGFRKFEVRGLALYLNNKKVFFRGVNRHDEHFHGEFPDAGRVMTEEERISDFVQIKNMNANSMRTAHYPNHPYNYYITDRLGIMAIEEGGPVFLQTLNDDDLIKKLLVQQTEMYDRDKNHASIVMWSIGNEFGGDKFLKYIKKAAELMRNLDTRPIMFTETSSRLTKEGFNYVDVVARNVYSGWYSGGRAPQVTPKNLKTFINVELNSLFEQYHGEYPDKPVFLMEFGGEAVCGQHASDPENILSRGDEEHQETIYKYNFRVLLSKKYVAGSFPWIIADFKTKGSGGTCQFTKHLNRKGLQCTDHKTNKRAYNLVKKIYSDIREKELAGE